MINLNIDGKYVKVPKGATILDAAKQLGIEIPTLCHLDLHDLGVVNKAASCRICVVEVKGRRNLAPACATPVTEGMEVHTNTMRVLNARKTVLELLLSDHPKDCLTCAKSGQCDLQDLAERFCLRENRYEGGAQSTYKKDVSPAIARDMDKCIMCRRCETMCNDVQTVGALSGVNRGFNAVVAPAFDMPLEESVCTFCGQCVAVCPTGALVERDYSWQVIEAIADPDKVVVVQTAPAVRAALGECFGMEPGTLVTGKMASALRQMGFNYVFDTDFAADLTIMEEGAELLDRITRFLSGDKSVRLPILTSCCRPGSSSSNTSTPICLTSHPRPNRRSRCSARSRRTIWPKSSAFRAKSSSSCRSCRALRRSTSAPVRSSPSTGIPTSTSPSRRANSPT